MIPLVTAAFLLAASAGAPASGEETYYAVDYLKPPEGCVLEVGGMDFLPDGRLVVSTRRGQVWMVENALAEDPAEARFHLFAEGLWEGLGLEASGGVVHVVQRGELSRLLDTDQDGRCDVIETVCDDWGLSGNYHEFAYGLPMDRYGNHYVSLNVAFLDPKWWHGKSPAPYRGWVLKVTSDGFMIPFASGFRSPCGLGMSAEGDLFLTDNQGDWMPSCPIFHVVEGGFYGHPASLDWTPAYLDTQTKASDTVPPDRAATDRRPAAVWIPYAWSRSAGNLVADTTGGRFGPFPEQMFLAELTNGMVLRVMLEKVRGEYQGAVVPFRQRVGSACRVAFAPDGTLFTGFTNRGWGGLAPSDGIARVRWTGETPFEIQDVHLLTDGFELTLTLPLGPDVRPSPTDVRIDQYDYDYWWEYGSPERDHQDVAVEAVEVAPDRRKVVLRAPGLVPAKVARVTLLGFTAQDGQPLLHEEFAYTINQLPEGAPATEAQVAKIVPPPPARERSDEGWLRLTYGDALDRWDSTGWLLCDAELDPDDDRRFRTEDGMSALVNTGSPTPSSHVSKPVLGDGRLYFRFMLPRGGDALVWIQGRYPILLRDHPAGDALTLEDLGALPAGPDFPGSPPALPAWRGPGQWHGMEVRFQAPRFDADGVKVENARILRVAVDDVLLQEDVELPGPGPGAIGPEVAEGPLVFQGDGSPVAIAEVRWAAAVPPFDPEGWTPLLGEDLSDWKVSDEGTWTLEDGVLIGTGARSHVFSPRSDYRNLAIHASVKISDGGNSGLYFRTAFGPGWPEGYEAQINSSFADPQKTGSLYGLSPVATQLVAPDTWFDYDVACRDEDAGTHVTISVNGVVITDYVDEARSHASGHVAIQQHHETSVVEVRDLYVRELD